MTRRLDLIGLFPKIKGNLRSRDKLMERWDSIKPHLKKVAKCLKTSNHNLLYSTTLPSRPTDDSNLGGERLSRRKRDLNLGTAGEIFHTRHLVSLEEWQELNRLVDLLNRQHLPGRNGGLTAEDREEMNRLSTKWGNTIKRRREQHKSVKNP